jgi:hypothetical protein
VRYLLRAERERAREVKLRNLLLMLLRIGVVLAIAFAASRPIGPLPGFGHAPTAVAIVLDNSRSTSAAGVDGPVLGALVRAAREVVDAAASGDRLWIVTFDGEVTGGAPDALRDALSRHERTRRRRTPGGRAPSRGRAGAQQWDPRRDGS